jgi:hypothetical protein
MPSSVLPTSPALPSPRTAPLSGPRGRRAMQTATEACRLLRRRGWTTSLAGFRVVGDTDVRLLAVSPGSAVAVEVLCPCPDTPDDDGPWAAVRVEGEERTVWRGPDRTCTTETLVRFVDDLIRRTDGELAQRYRFCG